MLAVLMTRCSWALRVLCTIFAMHGKSRQLDAFANAPSLEEQRKLWEKSIRPVLLSGSFVKLVLSNPIFLWNSLGVPMNQLNIFLNETCMCFRWRRDAFRLTRWQLSSSTA